MTKEEIEAENRRLKTEYGRMFDSVAEILFRHDPIGINFEDNTDEYYPETRTILPRLRNCQSVGDVNSAVHEEFVKWFDRATVGPKKRYEEIAAEIWAEWQAAK